MDQPYSADTYSKQQSVSPALSVDADARQGPPPDVIGGLKPMSTRRAYIFILSYLSVVASAEIIITYHDPKAGIIIHGILMFLVFAHAAFIYPSSRNVANLLMTIGIAPLIRVISLSTPLSSFSYIYWFLVLSIPLFAAILMLRAIQGLTEEDLGLVINTRKLHWEFGIIAAGFPLGLVEYYILKPEPIIESITVGNMVAPVLIFIVCTGLIEELIFRGIMQHNANRVFGVPVGIFLTSILFGFLHTGNLNSLSVVFAFAVGILYSLIRIRSGSIFGISLSHGILNSVLFLVAPLYW